MMKIAGIIPARYASTRFPGKPLADINGKSMIRRVYEQVWKAGVLEKIVVATDDQRIYDHVMSWNGEVILTKKDHPSGTDRCREAMELATPDCDYVINVQGDEPFIDPGQIKLLAELLNGKTELATLVKVIKNPEDITNPNVVKVVKAGNKAIYFSRSPVPYYRNAPEDEWLQHHTYFRHIGIYAYRSDVLKKITELPLGKLESAESLEQLRWLENGFSLKVAETEHHAIGIDTPEDLQRVLKVSQKNIMK